MRKRWVIRLLSSLPGLSRHSAFTDASDFDGALAVAMEDPGLMPLFQQAMSKAKARPSIPSALVARLKFCTCVLFAGRGNG